MIRAELTTARLTLRPVASQDREAVLAGLNDIAVSGWLSVVPFPYTAADFFMFQTELAKPGTTFVLEDAAGFAGILGLEKGRLGYWLSPRAQGLGYATEAARGVLGWHFARGGGVVEAGYFEGNHASAHVLHKLGFLEVGRGQVPCRALNTIRPHVNLTLTEAAYTAALPWEAQSPRLTFRALQATDAEALHQIVTQFEVTRQLGPNWPWPADPSYTMTRAQPFHGAGFVWGIFQRGALIGTVGVAAGELGYMLAPQAWGQGCATEACRVALSHAFDAGLDHVDAGVWADNRASQHVLEKLGFRVTGHDLGSSAARGADCPGLRLRLDRAGFR
jgi:RimJ/RimL family protein N-acetyltransferase